MIRTVRAHLNVDAQTHPGMTGKNNEDRYAVASFILDKTDKMPVLFAVLADGIGGHRAGEVAAELAVNHMMQAVAKSDGRHIRRTIEVAVGEASDAIAAHSESNKNLKGMGATCAAAWIVGDKLHTVYVGDSRIYLMRGGRIQQLTVDHTWVQEAIDRGVLTPEKAREHPNVHVIRRYLGSPVPPEPDFRLKLASDEGDQHAEDNQGFQYPNSHADDNSFTHDYPPSHYDQSSYTALAHRTDIYTLADEYSGTIDFYVIARRRIFPTKQSPC